MRTTLQIHSRMVRWPGYRVHKLPVTTLNMNALKGNVELSRKEIDRCKNFFALGCALLALRSADGRYAVTWITSKFGKNPELAKANEIALKTGYNFADTTGAFHYSLHHQESEDRSRQIPQDHRQRSHCAGICRCFATCRPAAVLWIVSDHAGV